MSVAAKLKPQSKIFWCIIILTLIGSWALISPAQAAPSAEMISIPISEDYFESGFLTPASCGALVCTAVNPDGSCGSWSEEVINPHTPCYSAFSPYPSFSPYGGFAPYVSFAPYSGFSPYPSFTPAVKTVTFTLNIFDDFDFSLSNSGNLTIYQGTSGSNLITITKLVGVTKPVSLSVSGLPAGATPAFSASSCSPDCSSLLTITTSASTPVGTYSITVTGAPLSRTTTFNLTVTPQTLNVTLTADPISGAAPLTTNLTATVSGTALGTINYAFWWNCSSATTSMTAAETACGAMPASSPGSCVPNGSIGMRCNAMSQETLSVNNSATPYLSAGIYSPKVVVERGIAPPAQNRTLVTVSTVVAGAPTADAGPGHSGTTGTFHSHTGATASDPDNDLTSYAWRFLSCPPPTTCPSITENRLGALPPAGGPVPAPRYTPISAGTYVLELKVFDALLHSAVDTVSENFTAGAGGAVDIEAAPDLVNPGGCSLLEWTTSGFSSCSISDDNPSLPDLGSVPTFCTGPSCPRVCPLVTTTFTLTCNPGAGVDSTTISVRGVPKFKEIPPR